MNETLVSAISALNSEQGWGLGQAVEQAYAVDLERILPDDCPELVLRRTIICYHFDRELVQSLRDQDHQYHEKAWVTWMAQAQAVLRSKGLAWSRDDAVDIEDLAQTARMELVRSIGSYKYESRFSTWAYQVIVRSAIGHVRRSQALKRAKQPQPIALSSDLEVMVHEADHPEAIANAAVLSDLIDSVLRAQADPRLVKIFHLWAHEDRRVVEIGALVGLSEARVRALLSQILQLLRQAPSIRSWFEHPDE